MFLDVLDIQILDLLKENSRAKLTALAGHLELTPAAIKYRIDRLVEHKIIEKFTISINKKVGHDVMAYFVINVVSKTHLPAIINSLKSLTEVSKISVLMGDPDLIADVTVSNMKTLINLLNKMNQLEEIQKLKVWFITDVISRD